MFRQIVRAILTPASAARGANGIGFGGIGTLLSRGAHHSNTSTTTTTTTATAATSTVNSSNVAATVVAKSEEQESSTTTTTSLVVDGGDSVSVGQILRDSRSLNQKKADLGIAMQKLSEICYAEALRLLPFDLNAACIKIAQASNLATKALAMQSNNTLLKTETQLSHYVEKRFSHTTRSLVSRFYAAEIIATHVKYQNLDISECKLYARASLQYTQYVLKMLNSNSNNSSNNNNNSSSNSNSEHVRRVVSLVTSSVLNEQPRQQQQQQQHSSSNSNNSNSSNLYTTHMYYYQQQQQQKQQQQQQKQA